MTTRHKGIIAYGTDKDRQKLAVLAHLQNKSGSEVLINLIRKQYAEAFGNADPEDILSS